MVDFLIFGMVNLFAGQCDYVIVVFAFITGIA